MAWLVRCRKQLRGDPHAGDLYVFRGTRSNLIKILWHDGLGMSLYVKRLEKGRFIWPSPSGGVLVISASRAAEPVDVDGRVFAKVARSKATVRRAGGPGARRYGSTRRSGQRSFLLWSAERSNHAIRGRGVPIRKIVIRILKNGLHPRLPELT